MSKFPFNFGRFCTTLWERVSFLFPFHKTRSANSCLLEFDVQEQAHQTYSTLTLVTSDIRKKSHSHTPKYFPIHTKIFRGATLLSLLVDAPKPFFFFFPVSFMPFSFRRGCFKSFLVRFSFLKLFKHSCHAATINVFHGV